MKNEKINETERTLAIIKPDGMPFQDEIVEMITLGGLTIVQDKTTYLDADVLKEHYAHIADKPFYPEVEAYMMRSEVRILVLEGVNAVATLRKLMGPTDSRLADEGTIRNRFGTDKSENAIHGSDSVENAEIEINRFFQKTRKREN